METGLQSRGVWLSLAPLANSEGLMGGGGGRK